MAVQIKRSPKEGEKAVPHELIENAAFVLHGGNDAGKNSVEGVHGHIGRDAGGERGESANVGK